MSAALTGGCQCGAVRFSVVGPLGRASLCHCRMCQKAFAAPYAALVTAPGGVVWTRGGPAHFHSSNKARRGFCAACGTPLTFEPEGGAVDLAILAFDHPDAIAPTIQHCLEAQVAWAGDTAGLPVREAAEAAQARAWYAAVVSRQHPDQLAAGEDDAAAGAR